MIEEFRSKSISPKSNYKVGAVLHTNLGKSYGGFNIEFDKIEYTLHAEQTAYINFLMNKTVNEYPTSMDVSAAPCGHCRQFLWSLAGKDMGINFDDTHIMLSQLLPHPFGGGDDVELIDDFSIDTTETDPGKYLDTLVDTSINNFTDFKGGCVLELYDGTLYGGFFIENNAFNPSINPIVMALCNMYLDGEDIYRVKNVHLCYTSEFDITGPLSLFEDDINTITKII